ncbi:MAG TPA: DUF2868 domain-containing protein [Ramlibacter sp.]
MEDGILQLDEARARQLVLVRAIEDVDTQGKLLSEVEREQLEREALESSRQGSGGSIDFGDYLQQRARRMLAAVENRNPRIAALQDREPWRPWLMAGLPLAACLLGAAIDRVDNPQQVNMLSPALLGVLAWNLAVYLLLVLTSVLPAAWNARAPWAGLQRWIAGVPGPGRRTGRLRADVLARFQQHWWQAAGSQQWLWWKQLLHLSAAAWGLGLAFSIVLGGIVREYRVGWESTLLGVEQVHAFLSVLFAPVVALLPFEGFSVADLERMAFRSGAQVGLDEARRWVWMYVALLLLVVVLPRVLLAGWTAWQRRRRARVLRIDLRDAYFVQVLSRVSPARVTIGVVSSDAAAREALVRMLREVADHAPPREHAPWTVLSTARGDALRVFEVPPDFRPPAPAVAAHAGGGAAAQAWLQDLLGRFKAAPRVQERDAVQAALADTDLMLLLPSAAADVQQSTRLLHWVAQPALVLVGEEEAAYRAAVQRLGLAAEVLPLARCTAHWLRDPVLLEAIAPRLPTAKRAGFERVAATWKDRNAVRFSEAMRLVAGELVRAACDAEEVGSAPVSLRHLVSAAERDAAQRAREGARGALLKRLKDGEAGVFAGLVQLHRTGVPVAPLSASRMDSGFQEQQTVDTPQAGMAGAATGAAMGAGIDLITGGLTLGAATALGAMIGGGAAYAAALWKNRGTPGGQPQVQVSDELLQTFTESLLLAYLAVAHRSLQPGEAGAPGTWRSEVVAAVEARSGELAALWQRARSEGEDSAVIAALGRELEGIARGLLARL